MSQFGIEPNLMATTSLILNIAVSGIAFINYARAGYLNKRLMTSFPPASIPASFLGGFFMLDEDLYFVLLNSVLTYVMVRMLFAPKKSVDTLNGLKVPPTWLGITSGAVIGLLSGMLGIGGGVILSPLIILMRWGTPKQAASTSALFICLNSISGLLGRFLGGNLMFGGLGPWLLPSGVLGALMGSYIGARRFSGLWTQRVL
jgi:uncharacterized membrane protein YfcA